VARVVREAYPDPTAKGEDWSVVDLEPVVRMKKPLALDAIKKDRKLADFALVKRGRLSVVPVSDEQFEYILALGEIKVPRR